MDIEGTLGGFGNMIGSLLLIYGASTKLSGIRAGRRYGPAVADVDKPVHTSFRMDSSNPLELRLSQIAVLDHIQTSWPMTHEHDF